MKSTLQKCYEKMTMIKHNPDQLRLMAGKFDNGEAAVLLVLDDDGGGTSVTPVAVMLDQARIDTLNPDWEYSKKIYKVIEDATRIDRRTKVGDFAGQFIMIDELFEKADF
jgi:hypothetical protein|tara:strand:+ start:562 stop:891 length:330 start_codon:yes stop_codon:yes gene_type:complete